jgi:DNA-binding NtrC family response regulator
MTAENSPGLTSFHRVLIVEDLEDTRQSLQELIQLGVRQAQVDTAEDGVRALQMLRERPYALVITDLRMPRTSGLGLLREIKNRNLSCAVLIVTGHGTIREAVEAMRLGAYDFLTKPVDPQQLVALVDRVLRECSAAPAAGAEESSDETVNLDDPDPPPADT